MYNFSFYKTIPFPFAALQTLTNCDASTSFFHLKLLFGTLLYYSKTFSTQQTLRKIRPSNLPDQRLLGQSPYCAFYLLLQSGTFRSQIAIKGLLCSFQIPGTSSVVQRKWKPLQPVSQPRGPGQQTKSRISAVAAEIKQIRARRKTARMLMVVLFVFAICYLPISILNVLKR